MNKRILVICPTSVDRRELAYSYSAPGYEFIYHWFEPTEFDLILQTGLEYQTVSASPQTIINDLCDIVKHKQIDGVITSDDYPGSVLAALVAQQMNLPGPDPKILIRQQHKYCARVDQQQHVAQATPKFRIINTQKDMPNDAYPFFIKPIKSFFSVHAHVIRREQEWLAVKSQLVLPRAFTDHYDYFFKTYIAEYDSAYQFVAEQLLTGMQVTVEGYCFEDNVTIIGVVDSVMYPGTYSFACFEYPSMLSHDIQQRMHAIAITYIQGIKLNNTLFNIEMIYNPDTDEIYIIELNTRMASQFADLYYKVDGMSTYQIACDIAVGKWPQVIQRGSGKYNYAASFVLRTFQDYNVISVPTNQQIEHVEQLFPDCRIYIPVKPGMKLSDELQDGKSFRYGLIHLGHHTREQLYDAFEQCKQLLPVQFE